MERHIGAVKFYDHIKGFGFIEFVEGDAGRDYFFHSSEVKRAQINPLDLKIGREVSFVLFPGIGKGLTCGDLKLEY